MDGSFGRGEIWWAYLGPVVGSEQDGRRPTLILSRTEFNETAAGRVIAAPLTSRQSSYPTAVQIRSATGLDRASWVLIDQVRTLDKRRFKKFIGEVDQETLDAATDVLRRLLFE